MAEFAELLELVQQGRGDELEAVLAENPRAAGLRDDNGVSLLLHALYNRRGEIAELLRAHVAELDVFEAAALGDGARLAELLSGGPGQDTDASLATAYAGDGFTALQLACYFRQPAATKVLLEHGADVEAVSKNGMALRAVHAAASSRDIDSLRLLLEHGADPNATQHGGFTPLHAAAANGNREMVQLLLENGADPNAQTVQGETPAQMAEARGHGELAELLGE